MNRFARNLITEWRRLDLPTSDATVVIAVSGGADSVSLLLAMYELRQRAKLGLRLVAAHFNHNIRGVESDADEEYVRHLTRERNIEFAAGRGSISPEGNLEQKARRVRYTFLENTARSLHAFAVLTGHTVNDQAETFLMNLIRGSGIGGLSCMSSVRQLGDEQGVVLVRPLLKWAKRGDTEKYCRDLGVEYRYDTMNEDTAFKRVRIRKVLLPLLEDMNPNIVETLANTAELMQHASDQSLNDRAVMTPELDLGHLKSLEKAVLYDTLRHWLTQMRGTSRQLELKHIKAIERLVFSEKSGRTAELPDGGRVVRSGGRLTFDENKVEN